MYVLNRRLRTYEYPWLCTYAHTQTHENVRTYVHTLTSTYVTFFFFTSFSKGPKWNSPPFFEKKKKETPVKAENSVTEYLNSLESKSVKFSNQGDFNVFNFTENFSAVSCMCFYFLCLWFLSKKSIEWDHTNSSRLQYIFTKDSYTWRWCNVYF